MNQNKKQMSPFSKKARIFTTRTHLITFHTSLITIYSRKYQKQEHKKRAKHKYIGGNNKEMKNEG